MTMTADQLVGCTLLDECEVMTTEIVEMVELCRGHILERYQKTLFKCLIYYLSQHAEPVMDDSSIKSLSVHTVNQTIAHLVHPHSKFTIAVETSEGNYRLLNKFMRRLHQKPKNKRS